MSLDFDKIPEDACGLKLFRIDKNDDAIACEPVRFPRGRVAVVMVLNRARISGRVEIGGDVQDHFADILSADQDILETVALDRKSYAALKNKWMRCKLEPSCKS